MTYYLVTNAMLRLLLLPQ